MSPVYHTPVLADEVAALAADRDAIVDGTVGGGGHFALFLKRTTKVLGVDRDADALMAARARLPSDVSLVHGVFNDPNIIRVIEAFAPDLIFFDLGVSSHQFDNDERGFSFRPGVRLDMRMNVEAPSTASDVLNTYSAAELRRVFRDLADEPRSHRLANEIVRRRERQRLETSDDFVNAIRAVLGSRSGPKDFARLFQGLRIEVNQELATLEDVLPQARDALVANGLLAIITYHSGEDRIVKHCFREWGRTCVCPPQMPICSCRGKPLGKVLTKSPISASADEMSRNPRARSAKLRVFRREL